MLDLGNWLDVEARLEPAALAPGEQGTLVVEISVPRGCHVESHEPSEPFLIPTTLELRGAEGVHVGPVSYPPDELRTFDWSPAVLRVYRGTVELTARVEVDSGAAPGSRRLTGSVRYQGCTESLCFPPAEQAAEAVLDVL